MSDTFTAEKLRWLEQVASDPSLPPAAMPVAVWIASFMNREHLRAWPAVGTIAEKTGRNVSAVRDGIKGLEARGHLSVDRTVGGQSVAENGARRSATNVYRWIIPCENSEGIPFENSQGSEADNPAKNRRVNPANISPQPFENSHPPLRKTEGLTLRKFAPNTYEYNPLNETTEETTEAEPSEGAADEDFPTGVRRSSLSPATEGNLRPATETESMSGEVLIAGEGWFQDFWDVYPRREGEARARKAFEAAVADGADPAHILAGAENVRAAHAARAAKDGAAVATQFTPGAARWLAERRWTDAPPAPVVTDLHAPVTTLAEWAASRLAQCASLPSMEELALAGF